MASLKDLIVQGSSRLIGNTYGTKFITDGGTSSQFVKGDGTLDSTSYYTLPSGGITSSDLASSIQSALTKASSSVQSITITGVNGTISPDSSGNVALPSIPTKVSDLTNDSGFLTTYEPIDLNVVGSGNGIANIQKTENTDSGLTITKGTFLTSHQSLALSNAYTGTTTGEPVATDTFETAISKLHSAVIEDERITAKALTDLNDRLDVYASDTIKSTSIPFAHVDSTSTSTVFTATVPGITKLEDGVLCYIRNNVVTSASGCTLNINGLGAKPMYATTANSSIITTQFGSGYTFLFIYNSSRVSGGCWDAYYGYANSTAQQLRTYTWSLPASAKFYRYRLLFTSADGTQLVPANTSTSTNATASRAVNQTKIDPFGKIMYYSYTTAINSGSRPSASYLYYMNTLTLGYSFNRTGAALTLTSYRPIYIKCAPQTDGSAIIDADTPYVQALPSTEDGKIYIMLGIAYSATAVELVPEHPVYCYKNGAIK